MGYGASYRVLHEARTRLPSSEPEALRTVPGGRPQQLEQWLVAQ